MARGLRPPEQSHVRLTTTVGIRFSPDSKHVAFIAMRNTRCFIVVDEQEGTQYELFLTGVVFDGPNRLHALAGRRQECVYVEVEIAVNR